jgi:protein SCO1/2
MVGRRRALLTGIATAALLVATACGSGTPPAATPTPTLTTAPAYHAAVNDPPLATPPLRLTAASGAPFDLASLHGDVVALFFGYTMCPDVCPLTLSTLTAARRLLPDDLRDGFRVVFVTVDPERDTPARLADYLPKFDPSFIGVGGAPDEVEATLQAWGVQHERVDVRPDGAYAMSHPSTILVLDRSGRWALTSHSGASAADIAGDVTLLLERPDGADASVATAGATTAAPAAAASAVQGLPTVDHGTPVPVASRAGVFFFAYPDGSVTRVDPAAPGRVEQVLPTYAEQPPPDDTQGGTLRAREIAYDPQTHLLWYAETHDAIHSVDLETGRPGPGIAAFGDVGIVGCSVLGNARSIALDLGRRRLIVPELTGAVLIYDLDTLELVAGIGPATFDDIVLGGFRHVVVDPATGYLWWAAANGDFVEYDLERQTRTGRVVHTEAPPDALGNAFRDLQVDPGRNLLVFQTAPDRLAAVDLETLEPVSLGITASGFGHFAVAPDGG